MDTCRFLPTARRLMLALALAACSLANALYKYGGEIRYQHVSASTHLIEVILFVRSSSVDTAHQVYLDLGDGSVDTIAWTESVLLPDDSSCHDLARVTYPTMHTYAGPGT